MSDLVKLARSVTDGLPPVMHWEGCERDHVSCLIERMADEIERLRTERDALLCVLMDNRVKIEQSKEPSDE